MLSSCKQARARGKKKKKKRGSHLTHTTLRLRVASHPCTNPPRSSVLRVRKKQNKGRLLALQTHLRVPVTYLHVATHVVRFERTIASASCSHSNISSRVSDNWTCKANMWHTHTQPTMKKISDPPHDRSCMSALGIRYKNSENEANAAPIGLPCPVCLKPITKVTHS